MFGRCSGEKERRRSGRAPKRVSFWVALLMRPRTSPRVVSGLVLSSTMGLKRWSRRPRRVLLAPWISMELTVAGASRWSSN